MSMRKRWGILMFLCVILVCLCPETAAAAERDSENFAEGLMKELDFGEIDEFLEKQTDSGMTFSEVVQTLMHEGISGIKAADVLEAVKNTLAKEMNTNRTLLIEAVLLAFCFSVLKNFAGVFQSSYISNLCFMLVYCVLSVLLLKTFLTFRQITEQTLGNYVDFMKFFIPVFGMSMMFSASAGSSAGFYQLAFLIIYLIEWLFLHILMPMIHIYALMEVLGHLLPKERFSGLTELCRDMIHWGIKIAVGAVMGLSVVQNLIGPAKDRIGQGIFGKAAAAVPGIGNAVNSATELLLGSGIVIKNCIGAAGAVVLFLLAAVPLAKTVCLSFFYKLAAALTEPVADKRIAGCLKGLANGGALYVKMLWYGFLLFFLTIALAAFASGSIF